MATRQPDDCIRCHEAVPWDVAVTVPTASGAERQCHIWCATQLSQVMYRRMSRSDQVRVFAYGVRGLPRHGLGLTPRTFAATKGG